MPFRATSTFQKCASQGSCWSPGSQPGSDHKRKLFPQWRCRVAGRGQGTTSLQSAGLCRDFLPSLPFFLLWALLRTPQVTVAQPTRKTSFRLTLLYVPRRAKSVVFTQSLSMWSRSLPETHRGLFSPWGTKQKLFVCFLPTVRRSHIPSAASRTERWPRAERWQVCGSWPKSGLVPTDNLQIFTEGLLSASSVPRSAGTQRCPV